MIGGKWGADGSSVEDAAAEQRCDRGVGAGVAAKTQGRCKQGGQKFNLSLH